MILNYVERDLSLETLVVDTCKISWTSLSTSDSNSFWHAFNSEIIFIASFVPNCFSATIFLIVFFLVSNLNLSNSLQKSEDIAKVHDQNLLDPTLLKAAFPLPEEFQCKYFFWDKNLAVVLLDCNYKLYRSFSFLIMTQNFSFFRWFWVIDF